MSTPYSNIFGRFALKVKDYNLDRLYTSSVSAYEDFLSGYLLNAVPKFSECRTDLSDRDEGTKTFNNTLSEQEEEILAEMMVVEWTEQNTMKSEDMNRILGDSDFKLYSGANSLRENRKLRDDAISKSDKLRTDYTWSNFQYE